MIIESHLNVFENTLTTSEQTGTDVVFGKPFSNDGVGHNNGVSCSIHHN